MRLDILFFIPVITIATLICKLYPYESQKNKRYITVTVFVVASLVIFGIFVIYFDGIIQSLFNLSVTGISLIDGIIKFILIVCICLLLLIFIVVFVKISDDKSILFSLSVMANVKYSGGKYADCNIRTLRNIYFTIENNVLKPFSTSPAVAMCELELAELIITVKPAMLKRFYNLSTDVQTTILLMRSINSQKKDELDYSCYAKYNPSKDIYYNNISEILDYCNKFLPKLDKFSNYLISETKDKSS